jgi:hypothetical protein
MLPAHERLVTEERLVPEVDDRLVEEPQLLVGECVPEVGLQLQGVDVVPAERALVHLDAGTAAVGLGAGEGALRLAQQVVRRGVGAQGETDARREADLPAVDEEGLVENPQEPVGEGPEAVEVLDVLGHQEELVGAQPDGGVLDPRAPAQPVRDLAEQQVPGLVAQRVVDRPEPVDVEVHQADLQPAATGQRDGVPETVGQRAAVGQPGERVGESPADQVVLGATPVGDVDERQDDELGRAVAVPDDLVGLHHPQLGAVGPPQPPLAVQEQVRVQVQGIPGAGQEAEIGHRRVVGVGEEVDVPAGQLLGRPPRECAQHRVGDQYVAAEVDECLGDRRRQEQGLEQLPAVGEQGVDGPHALPGCPGHLRGGKAHLHSVTHGRREVTEPDHGES